MLDAVNNAEHLLMKRDGKAHLRIAVGIGYLFSRLLATLTSLYNPRGTSKPFYYSWKFIGRWAGGELTMTNGHLL